MSTFVTVSDVERAFQRDFTTSSSPTTSQVQDIIDEAESELNNILSRFDITVSSGTDSFKTCKRKLLKIVQADMVLEFSHQIDYTGDPTKYLRLQGEWAMFKKELQRDPSMLYDASRDETPELPKADEKINQTQRDKFKGVFHT